MMKELIDRAVHHVARNASRNTSARPLGQEDPRLIPKVAEPAARRWWPFGRVRVVLQGSERSCSLWKVGSYHAVVQASTLWVYRSVYTG